MRHSRLSCERRHKVKCVVVLKSQIVRVHGDQFQWLMPALMKLKSRKGVQGLTGHFAVANLSLEEEIIYGNSIKRFLPASHIHFWGLIEFEWNQSTTNPFRMLNRFSFLTVCLFVQLLNAEEDENSPTLKEFSSPFLDSLQYNLTTPSCVKVSWSWQRSTLKAFEL